MSNSIRFTYKDREYKLGFTRKTVKQMESGGFNIENIESKPLTTITELFAGSFLANHRFTKRELIDEIHVGFERKDELNTKLIELYNGTVSSLYGGDEQSEDNENLISWE